ncbi:MAG: hypothetical protein EOS07_21820 [Mesorhizobium sp.]|uniref:hypothetical protein n=1 Tax=Mesorhizobium sp. TaxID=1871066 RepID=UPI000FE6F18C|nr:hypothetical protein [Mesorhizobium sp.]RWO06281.1 MAG: hypothetical protein EOS07_21820 [Mesorhizobium sp.]RWP29855.1 MAG: hypothetical protein EOR03_25695 [Mesorhizobium sp.]RWP69577.1 MAG: hypothetical protein EOR07_03365 [Mesorhizobium sp.]
MVGWRDQKRKALGTIHRTFEIPAVYLTHTAGTPMRVDVRLHGRPVVSDVQTGDWGNAASLIDTATRIVFQKTDALTEVLTNAYVIFGNSEAYITGPCREREGYLWVEVSEVPKADLVALLAQSDTASAAFEGILL